MYYFNDTILPRYYLITVPYSISDIILILLRIFYIILYYYILLYIIIIDLGKIRPYPTTRLNQLPKQPWSPSNYE